MPSRGVSSIFFNGLLEPLRHIGILVEANCEGGMTGSHTAIINAGEGLQTLRNALRMRCRQRREFFVSSCSQTRTTCQPSLRSARLTNRSRAIFAINFFAQKSFPVRTPPAVTLSLSKGPAVSPFPLLSTAPAPIELFLNHLAGLE